MRVRAIAARSPPAGAALQSERPRSRRGPLRARARRSSAAARTPQRLAAGRDRDRPCVPRPGPPDGRRTRSGCRRTVDGVLAVVDRDVRRPWWPARAAAGAEQQGRRQRRAPGIRVKSSCAFLPHPETPGRGRRFRRKSAFRDDDRAPRSARASRRSPRRSVSGFSHQSPLRPPTLGVGPGGHDPHRRLRPDCLARYIARSASFRTSVNANVRVESGIPRETAPSRPSTCAGPSGRRRGRRARSPTDCMTRPARTSPRVRSASREIRRNSSPPQRIRRSESRTTLRQPAGHFGEHAVAAVVAVLVVDLLEVVDVDDVEDQVAVAGPALRRASSARAASG